MKRPRFQKSNGAGPSTSWNMMGPSAGAEGAKSIARVLHRSTALAGYKARCVQNSNDFKHTYMHFKGYSSTEIAQISFL